MPTKGSVYHFFTKVAGISHANSDGTSRQQIAARCQPLEQLDLDTEEDNPHDPSAVAVLRRTGEQLGYLNRGLAKEVASRSPRGYRYGVFVANVTGGGSRNRGVNLLVVVADPTATDRDAQQYVNQLDLGNQIVGRSSATTVSAGGNPSEGCMVALVLLAVGILLCAASAAACLT